MAQIRLTALTPLIYLVASSPILQQGKLSVAGLSATSQMQAAQALSTQGLSCSQVGRRQVPMTDENFTIPTIS